MALQRCASGIKHSASRPEQEQGTSGGINMVEHDINSFQAVLNFYPHVDGNVKAHVLKYRDKLRVGLSFHRQSIPVILQCTRRSARPSLSHRYPLLDTILRLNFTASYLNSNNIPCNMIQRGKT